MILDGEGSQNKPHSAIKYDLITIITCFALMFLLAILKPCYVSGDSMLPAFHNGQVVRAVNVRKVGDVERGDVIIFLQDGQKLIKRVFGMPNETVSIEDGRVIINGYAIEDITELVCCDNLSPITLEENEFFVLGDNRTASLDSRTFGAVSLKNIKRKVVGWGYPFTADKVNLLSK